MARRLKPDIPGPDRRVTPAEIRERGFDALFAPALRAPLRRVVELGFGRGEFLLERARAEPEAAFLGVELSHRRVFKMARRLARLELENVRLVEERAEIVVADLLVPGSIERFWINFPDPWPKKRHHRRRLVQPGFIGTLATRLAAGGRLEVATDDSDYAAWIDAVLAAEPGLESENAPAAHVREAPGRMRTAYELEWRARGRIPYFWTYRRPAASVAPPSGSPT